MNSNRKPLFIALATDSLSMPRPWNQKQPNLNPELATTYFDTYPYKLKQLLSNAYPNVPLELNNYATRAGGIATIASRIRDIVSWLAADIGILHFGITDCWLRGEERRQNLPIDKFTESYKELMSLKNSLNPEMPLFIVGILPTNQHMLSKNPTQNEINHDYCLVMNENLGENCIYIDMEAEFEKFGEKLLHPDGHHLSNSGHDVVAQRLSQHIVKLIPEMLPVTELC